MTHLSKECSVTHESLALAAAHRCVVALFVGASIAACAGPTSAAKSEQTAAQPASSSSRYILVQADLEKAKAENAYDAITKLRPEFLRGHNENTSFVQQSIKGGSKDPGAGSSAPSSAVGGATLTSAAAVMVYKDNVRLSGVDDLRQIQLSTIREIRYLQGPEAVIRFGTNNSAGAILVTSK
jgi:hypothetical protein